MRGPFQEADATSAGETSLADKHLDAESSTLGTYNEPVIGASITVQANRLNSHSLSLQALLVCLLQVQSAGNGVGMHCQRQIIWLAHRWTAFMAGIIKLPEGQG